MKKLGFLTSVLTILLMASCSNKTRSEEITADSTQMDSVMVADDDSYDIWTVEAVDAQIRACFDEVNKKAADYPIDIIGLDKMFCSKEFLELEEQLYKKRMENKVMFEDDNGFHWLADIASPSTIDSINVELLTGDQAQAKVWLSDEYGRKGYLEMILYLEDGAWKIHDWINDDVYPSGTLYKWMQNLLDDDKETNLNDYTESLVSTKIH